MLQANIAYKIFSTSVLSQDFQYWYLASGTHTTLNFEIPN